MSRILPSTERRQKFEGLSRFKKREGSVDQGIDLLFRQERENFGQILAHKLGVFSVRHRDAIELAHASAQSRPEGDRKSHVATLSDCESISNEKL